jgi:hypothetical protein
MVPEEVHLYGQWLGERHHVLPLDDQEVILLVWCFSSSVLQKMLVFFSVGHHCAYSLCFATPYIVEDLGTGKPSIHVHTVTLPFYHTTCQQHWTLCCVLRCYDVPPYIHLGCRRSRFLPLKVHTYLSSICGAFLWYKQERIYTLEMHILPRR